MGPIDAAQPDSDLGCATATSRRALLQASVAMAVATSGVGRTAAALADPTIAPFTYRAPQSAQSEPAPGASALAGA